MGRKPKLCPHGILGIKNCRKCHNEYIKKYRKNHPKKFREYGRKRRSAPKYKENQRGWQKKRREKNPEKVREYGRNYFRRHKLELVRFMGGKCTHCGLEPDDVDGCMAVFVIDEIKPLGVGKKKFTNLSKKDLEFAKKLFLEKKTQLLCQNCSALKSWKNGDYAYRNLYKSEK